MLISLLIIVFILLLPFILLCIYPGIDLNNENNLCGRHWISICCYNASWSGILVQVPWWYKLIEILWSILMKDVIHQRTSLISLILAWAGGLDKMTASGPFQHQTFCVWFLYIKLIAMVINRWLFIPMWMLYEDHPEKCEFHSNIRRFLRQQQG